MTPDEQEALSLKHSNSALILLPLSSGKVAIFDNSRKLLQIREPPLEYHSLALLSLAALSSLLVKAAAPVQPQSSAEELGF